MSPEKVIKHFGGVAATAAALGYTSQAVQLWQKSRRISARSQRYIEAITAGKLQADRSVSLRVRP